MVDLAHSATRHSSLPGPRLRRWIEEDCEHLVAHRRPTEAAQVWEELDRDTGVLYRGTRLAVVRDWTGSTAARRLSREEWARFAPEAPYHQTCQGAPNYRDPRGQTGTPHRDVETAVELLGARRGSAGPLFGPWR
ncbi:hypothetical protein [Streptomyces sp. HUAS TT7]|uniref:hypothetical protein n=1 Tax=Streptomyces sp. HUAS TT7 TaxID=3447507 RepID=UPI003F65DA0E